MTSRFQHSGVAFSIETIKPRQINFLLTKKKKKTKNIDVFQYNKTRPHTFVVTGQKLLKLYWDMLPHPPYSPDLAPHYNLFHSIRNSLAVRTFTSNDNVKPTCGEIFCWKRGGDYEITWKLANDCRTKWKIYCRFKFYAFQKYCVLFHNKRLRELCEREDLPPCSEVSSTTSRWSLLRVVRNKLPVICNSVCTTVLGII